MAGQPIKRGTAAISGLAGRRREHSKLAILNKYGARNASVQNVPMHASYAFAAGLAYPADLHKPLQELAQRLEPALAERNMCHL